MSDSDLKKISIDPDDFNSAFNRDVDYHDVVPQQYFLDKETGEILRFSADPSDTMWHDDEYGDDDEVIRTLVAANPRRFIEIHGRTHSEHHGILSDFLRNYDNWESEEACQAARGLYLELNSIGKWIAAVGEQTSDAFHAFKEERLREMQREFLKENGIAPFDLPGF